jgi:nitrilase
MERVKVAAVLAAPVWLDREATIDKVIALTEQAAAAGAGLVAFPEAFVLGYPDWMWRTRPWDQHATDLYARLLEQAVVVGSPATTALADAAGRLGVWLSVGVEELDTSSTTIYNTLLHFAPDGTLAARHHKLMPTGGERLVWGNGDGSTLTTLDTPFGRLAGLICWENYMPLARAALYSQGIDIYLAPTWDNSDVWEPTLRHIVKEGRVYVVGVTACIRGADVPTDLPGRDELYPDPDGWLSKGNTAIIGPDGDMLAGPLIAEAGFVYADLDADRVRAARQQFDPVGHYSRSDILHLTVNTTANLAVAFHPPDPLDSNGTGTPRSASGQRAVACHRPRGPTHRLREARRHATRPKATPRQASTSNTGTTHTFREGADSGSVPQARFPSSTPQTKRSQDPRGTRRCPTPHPTTPRQHRKLWL